MSAPLPAPDARPHAEGLDIGFVAMGFPPDVGGVETHLGELARELTLRGHRVHVLCLDMRSEAEPYTVRDETEAHAQVRRVAYRWQDHRALADLGLRRAANDVVMAWLAERPCDVIHVHHASGFAAGVIGAVRDMGRPVCVTLHDYWFLCPRGQMVRVDGALCESVESAACAECLTATWPHLMPSAGGERRGTRGVHLSTDEEAARSRTEHALEMLALADRLFTPSDAARAVFERAGVPAGRIRVLANGVDARNLATAVSAERRAAPRREGRLAIGVLGSAQPSKGVLEFARAALSIESPDLALEVHGPLEPYHGDPSYVDLLRELAARDPRLSLRGPYTRAELARVLARLDVVAVPSLWNEVFGLSAREARAAGLFVLASDRGGLAELAGDPQARLLPPGDAAAWRAAIEELLRGPLPIALRPAAVVRGSKEVALELETHYVDLVRALSGHEPALRFEPGGDRPRGSALPPPPPESVARRVWRFLRGD